MSTEISLAGKTCLITGASGGLGQALAKAFAQASCSLVLLARNQEKLDSLSQKLQSSHPDIAIHCYVIDLENSQALAKLAKEICKNHNVELLINNAGVFPVSSLEETSMETVENCVAVNLYAPIVLSKYFSKPMQKNNWGRIINIGSSSAYSGFASTSIYCATKHALLGFSRALHNELKDRGIRTFCVSPGSIQTPMGKQVLGQDYDTFIDPGEVAEYCVFLSQFNGNMVSEEIRLNRVCVQ